MKQFFDREMKVGRFIHMDDAAFAEILGKLRQEFRLSNSEMETKIKARIQSLYAEQARMHDMEVSI